MRLARRLHGWQEQATSDVCWLSPACGVRFCCCGGSWLVQLGWGAVRGICVGVRAPPPPARVFLAPLPPRVIGAWTSSCQPSQHCATSNSCGTILPVLCVWWWCSVCVCVSCISSSRCALQHGLSRCCARIFMGLILGDPAAAGAAVQHAVTRGQPCRATTHVRPLHVTASGLSSAAIDPVSVLSGDPWTVSSVSRGLVITAYQRHPQAPQVHAT